ncbi:MAG: molybdopterin-dependent oxidoreductase [Armatimonadetes bacterium]|nr:molybdopterin-dependent oxidoreductase [Armatimonadota bacterium]
MASIAENVRLLERQQDPYNAEPDPAELVKEFVTPRELFFIRNHGGVPEIDPTRYRLRVEGTVDKALELTLNHLRSDFVRVRTTATLQCAGNRRQEQGRMRDVPGVPWSFTTLGNAEWGGVRLKDVLERAGVGEETRHVQFRGLDRVPEGFRYGASIPLEKALRPETLLAFEMNGAPLVPAHGAPVRVVVPGFIGARNVKWVDSIALSADESPNFYQQEEYKVSPPGSSERTVDWSRVPAIEEWPLNSAICVPGENQRLKTGRVQVRGYALGPGLSDRTLSKVEVSADGGHRWQQARLLQDSQPFQWVLWEASIELGPGRHELVVRACDSAGETQPQSAPWNVKGYLHNAWHRVPVIVEG